ncbi:MAG TPA: hypothetical protein VIH59_24315 [Candidatus Tectomicrobia bacterium]|jgi:hypothetical protein
MEAKRPVALAVQPLVHPLDVIPQYVTASSQALGWQGITVWHTQSPAKEIDVPPLTAHTVFLVLNSGPRLVQQRDGRHIARGIRHPLLVAMPSGGCHQW